LLLLCSAIFFPDLQYINNVLLHFCAAGAILIALVVFGMMTYASGKYPVGSIGAVWENLQVGVLCNTCCYVICDSYEL
jgi:hypothetical protein